MTIFNQFKPTKFRKMMETNNFYLPMIQFCQENGPELIDVQRTTLLFALRKFTLQ